MTYSQLPPELKEVSDLEDLGKYGQSYRKLLRYVKKNPEEPAGLYKLSWHYLTSGEQYQEQAKELIEGLLKRFPDSLLVRRLLGILLVDLEDWEQLLQASEDSLVLYRKVQEGMVSPEPNNYLSNASLHELLFGQMYPAFLKDKVKALRELKRYEEALEIVQKHLAQGNKNPTWLHLEQIILALMGEGEQVVQLCKNERGSQNDADGLRDTALIYMDYGTLEQALPYQRRLLAYLSLPRDFDDLYTYITLLLETGSYREARDISQFWYRSGRIRKKPHLASLLYVCVLASERMGDTEETGEWLKELRVYLKPGILKHIRYEGNRSYFETGDNAWMEFQDILRKHNIDIPGGYS